MIEFITSIGGWKTILGAGLSIVAALLTLYLKSKQIFPFKPRMKKVLDEDKKFESKLDKARAKNDKKTYTLLANDVLDERERILRLKENDSKTNK